MLAPVLQKLHSTVQQINIGETNCIIHWIGIYPVDNFIHLFNNWGLVYEERTLVAWMIFPNVTVTMALYPRQNSSFVFNI